LEKNNLKVLRGGLLDSAATSRKIFISAYVTNTRLMGVLGMYIHFSLPDNQALSDLHQFFYFDAEEFGFETYQSVLGNDTARISEIEHSLIGGLGGEKVPLTLREAQYLLQEYVRLNRRMNIPLPEGIQEYGFLLDHDIMLSQPDLYILMCKQCVSTTDVCEVINYFLMRVTGKDFRAASFLTNRSFDMDLFPEFKAGTFCKNSIEPAGQPDVYLCESLCEFGNSYHIAVTAVTVSGLSISEARRISCFKISPAEAAMMLARSEFISVYEMLEPPEDFTAASTALSASAMATPHENGILYMMFHANNKHVAKWEYRLNEDVLGMYYVSSSGQLLAAAYSLEEIKKLENDLAKAPVGRTLIPTGKYEFQEPVLYEFIQSGFAEFEDFVDAIKTGEE